MSTAPTIYGKHVVLRALAEIDRSVMEAKRSPEFLRMVGINTDEVTTPHEVRNAFDQALADPNPLHWVVTVQGRCIGTAFLHSLVKNDQRARYAIGIFEPSDWGKNFGTETTRLVLDYAFGQLGLHRVDVRVLAYNQGALRCYEKCGFVSERVERESAWVDGQWHNDIIMGILVHEHLSA